MFSFDRILQMGQRMTPARVAKLKLKRTKTTNRKKRARKMTTVKTKRRRPMATTKMRRTKTSSLPMTKYWTTTKMLISKRCVKTSQHICNRKCICCVRISRWFFGVEHPTQMRWPSCQLYHRQCTLSSKAQRHEALK